jgi:hypothetical protein
MDINVNTSSENNPGSFFLREDMVAGSLIPDNLKHITCLEIETLLHQHAIAPGQVRLVGLGESGLGIVLMCDNFTDPVFLKLYFDTSADDRVIADFAKKAEPENAEMLFRITKQLSRKRGRNGDVLSDIYNQVEAYDFVERECSDLGHVTPHVYAIATFNGIPCGYIAEVIDGPVQSPASSIKSLMTRRALINRGIIMDDQGKDNYRADVNDPEKVYFLDIAIDRYYQQLRRDRKLLSQSSGE